MCFGTGLLRLCPCLLSLFRPGLLLGALLLGARLLRLFGTRLLLRTLLFCASLLLGALLLGTRLLCLFRTCLLLRALLFGTRLLLRPGAFLRLLARG
ncbi:hypothetical protein FHS96_004371 [Sphingomonas zeicaulis]|uniref:hypothetical protein n=1 Tax=Sphingomonas zeicaulis TaxID=1632740 RepID=UPI003D22E519